MERMLQKFSNDQKVVTAAGVGSKRARAGWVHHVSTYGGFCRGSGKLIKKGTRLYYIRFNNNSANPTLYTYSEEYLREIRK